MKRSTLITLITALIVIISGGFVAYLRASQTVTVSAVVLSVNNAPTVLNVAPSNSTISIQRSKSKLITLQIQDLEGDVINYTINPPYGSVTPIDGTINDSANLIAGTAYIPFTYLAPATPPGGIINIVVTLNDGPNLTTKNIPIFVF